jgi:hypothetical protein
MITIIHSYFSVPGRLRFLIRWLAEFVVFLAQIAVLALLAWAVFGLIEQRGGFLNPQSHQPLSPDFISHHSRRNIAPRRERGI